MAAHNNRMSSIIVLDNLLLLRFPKWGVTYLHVPLVEGLSERGEEASRSQGPHVEYGHLTFK